MMKSLKFCNDVILSRSQQSAHLLPRLKVEPSKCNVIITLQHVTGKYI